MNPLAKELNDAISASNSNILDMLSEKGKRIFMPKGILTQSAQAKEKAHRFNATIGIATADNQPMYLKTMKKHFADTLTPSEIFPYAPAMGVPALRKAWKDKMVKENPSLKDKLISNPVITNALTNGLATIGELFLNDGDILILPDQFWGNYKLLFTERLQAEIRTYPTFIDNKSYNIKGLLELAEKVGKEKGKATILLNFPNNPTGYSITKKEAEEVASGLKALADKGIKLIVISDDAYFGLFFHEDICKESLFAMLANASENLLAIRADGTTKESFSWGFRVGFLTYGTKASDYDKLYHALETKTAGILRSTISSGPLPSQYILLKSLTDPNFLEEREACNKVIEARCQKVHEIVNSGKYNDEFIAYPFNSGYFMTVKLTSVNAEELRLYLLDNYGIGVISNNATDIRIAFSGVNIEHIEEMFADIYKAIKELKKII